MDLISTLTDNGLPNNPFQEPGQTSSFPSLPNIPVPSKLTSQVLDSTNAVLSDASPDELPHGYRFPHLAHIPMFPLYTSAEAAALYKKQQERDRVLSTLQPEPELKDKVLFHVLKIATGGVNIDSKRKMDNNLKKFRAAAKNYSASQNRKCILTRWAVAPAETRVTWFVDVFECRTLGGHWKGNIVHLKTSGNQTIKLLEKIVVKNLRPTKSWRKTWNFKNVEEVVVIGSDQGETQMEIVAREESIMSPVEARQAMERFDFEWVIPSLLQ